MSIEVDEAVGVQPSRKAAAAADRFQGPATQHGKPYIPPELLAPMYKHLDPATRRNLLATCKFFRQDPIIAQQVSRLTLQPVSDDYVEIIAGFPKIGVLKHLSIPESRLFLQCLERLQQCEEALRVLLSVETLSLGVRRLQDASTYEQGDQLAEAVVRLMPGLQELALQCSSEECDTLLNFDVKQLEGLKQLRVLRIQGINMPVDPHDFWPLWAAEKLVQASQYTLQVYVDCELDLTCYQAYSWPGDSEEAVAREEEKAESDIIEKLAWCTELSDLLGGGVLVTDLKVARLPDRLLSSTTTTSDGGMEGRLEAAQQQQQRTERHQEWLEQHRRRHARSRQGEGQEQGGGDGEEDGEGLLVQIDNVAFAQLAFPWEDPESRQQRLQLARRALRSVQKLDLSEFEKEPEQALQLLQLCPSLTALSCRTSDPCQLLPLLPHLRHITSLNLNLCSVQSKDGISFVLYLLSQLSQLRKLKLTCIRVRDAPVEVGLLASLADLEELEVDGCIRAADLQRMASAHPRLRCLTLNGLMGIPSHSPADAGSTEASGASINGATGSSSARGGGSGSAAPAAPAVWPCLSHLDVPWLPSRAWLWLLAHHRMPCLRRLGAPCFLDLGAGVAKAEVQQLVQLLLAWPEAATEQVVLVATGVNGLNQALLPELAPLASRVRRCGLWYALRLEPGTIRALARALPHLEALSLMDCTVHDDSAYEAVSCLPRLRVLCMSLGKQKPSRGKKHEPKPPEGVLLGAVAACRAARQQREGEGGQGLPDLTILVPSQEQLEALVAGWHAHDPAAAAAAATGARPSRVHLRAFPRHWQEAVPLQPPL